MSRRLCGGGVVNIPREHNSHVRRLRSILNHGRDDDKDRGVQEKVRQQLYLSSRRKEVARWQGIETGNLQLQKKLLSINSRASSSIRQTTRGHGSLGSLHSPSSKYLSRPK